MPSAGSSAETLADGMERELRGLGTHERAEQEKRYLRSSLVHLGCGVPAIRACVRRVVRAHPELGRAGTVALARALWREPVHERRAAAVFLLEAQVDRLTSRDLPLVERFLRQSRTWALVDDLAATVVGPLVERDARLGRTLDRWAADRDFWIRRAAMLALLLPLRRGGGDFARFGRYADAMLDEREFFIRKAIGWVLRETAKKRPALVHRWLRPRATRASGVTMREAVRYLPAAMRRDLLRSDRARRAPRR